MSWLETHVVLDFLDKQNQKDADEIKQNQERANKEVEDKNREYQLNEAEAALQRSRDQERTINDDINAEQAAKVPRLEKEVAYYKALLCKPMSEIAQENADFKTTYLKQQEIVSKTIVSQHAFKELAMDYGEQLGKSPAQVEADSKSTEEKVLNNTTRFDNGVCQEVLSNLDNSEKVAEIKAQREAEEKEKIRLVEEREAKLQEIFDRTDKKMEQLKANSKARREAEEAAKADAAKKSKWKIW